MMLSRLLSLSLSLTLVLTVAGVIILFLPVYGNLWHTVCQSLFFVFFLYLFLSLLGST